MVVRPRSGSPGTVALRVGGQLREQRDDCTEHVADPQHAGSARCISCAA